jgi:hypothetical protein
MNPSQCLSFLTGSTISRVQFSESTDHSLYSTNSKSSVMATEALPVTSRKDTQKHSGDSYGHSEDHGLRQQTHLDLNDATRGSYNNPIGGPPSQYGGATATSVLSYPALGDRLGDRDYYHRRRQIRHRLKQKYMAKGPMVGWTKFMHSETKNSMPFTILLR